MQKKAIGFNMRTDVLSGFYCSNMNLFWIMAQTEFFIQVVSFNLVTNKYEVDDIDEEGKERHTLSRRRVVSLPQWKASPDTDPDAIHFKGTVSNCTYRLKID